VERQALELRLGVNHVGRDAECDFTIAHPSVSSLHCDLILSNDGVMIRDCGSTNGTFLNGEGIKEAWLRAGQTVQLGEVELLVENTDAIIAIPEYKRDRPKPPVMTVEGSLLCPTHPRAAATFKCTGCSQVMCSSCVRVLRHKGGQPLFLCPHCSHKCERIAVEEKPKTKSFLQTVKMKLANLTGRIKTGK
jgi:hypothetical protein